MELMNVLFITFICFVVVGVVFRRMLTAVIEDYVIDGLLSTLDTFFGGALGLDFGDFIASLILFVRERNVVGILPALFIAWEASNFFPLGLIPGVELVTNAFPAVTLTRLIASRYGAAERSRDQLKADEELAESMGDRTAEESVQKVSRLIEADDPIDALALAKSEEQNLRKRLGPEVEQVIEEVQGRIDTLSNTQFEGYPEAFDVLRSGIAVASQILDASREAYHAGNLKEALERSREASQKLATSAQEFDRLNNQ